MRRAFFPAAVGLGAALFALGAASTCVHARVLPGDAFLCSEARAARAARGAPPLPTFHARVGVPVIDRFTLPLASERYTLDLKKAEGFCRPGRIDDTDVVDALLGLEVYEARRTRRKPAPPPLPVVTETIETALGTLQLRIGGVGVLAVPTLATGSVGGGATERDHYACYQVKAERGTAFRRSVLRVPVRTADGTRTIEVRKPLRLCVPASVRGDDPGAPKHPLDLLCFDARVARGDEADPASSDLLATRNGFGHEVLKVGATRQLCVPAARTDVAVPTPTPFPTFTPPPTPTATTTPVVTPRPPTVRIEPAGATALVRDRVCFGAVLERPDGSTVDVTTTALWRVVDGAIAVPAGSLDGKRCFLGVAIGSTDLTARDAGTGAVSPPARLTAEWPIFKLTVGPRDIGMRPGDIDTLTATASFTDDRTRNVTQHVRYESLAPGVVRAPNVSGNRSRIEAAAVGATQVVVSDPFSSLTDTIRVAVGALRAITVNTGPLLFPGEHASLQATGSFDGGFDKNLTQDVSYESSDPGVAVATNAPGDRSRVDAVSAGTTTIVAVDPRTGIRSRCCGIVAVLGDLVDLTIAPRDLSYRVGIGGDALLLHARGLFELPPASLTSRSISDRVEWSASAPGVVTFGPVDGQGRQPLVPVGPGEVQVTATDPASGIVAAPATVAIYDHLDRIELGTSSDDPAELEERAIAIGTGTFYVPHGYFDGGRHRILDDVLLVASDPALVEIDGTFVRGRRPGTVTIAAVDLGSGVSSNDAGGRSAILHVYGDIERIVLSPATLTLDAGASRTLTAVAHHTGGVTENLTQRLEYTSSDPSVVVATNEPGSRSRIRAVAEGTATISALDPVTGVTSTASGDDTVVTVVDDQLVRLVVSPSARRVAVGAVLHFTATGHFESGATVNYTQRSEWFSSDPQVAFAANVAGDRSRIEARAPGSVTIAAQDVETQLRSTDTGDDATVTVAALASLALAPTDLELSVGSAFSLTTVGLVTGADPVNVTQEAVYTSSDPAIVRATNQSGNRSRIEAVAPGTATITAHRASDDYLQATDSNAITVTVVPAE